MWLLCETMPGDNVLLSEVTTRVRWFYAITLALNVLCSSALLIISSSVLLLLINLFPQVLSHTGFGKCRERWLAALCLHLAQGPVALVLSWQSLNQVIWVPLLACMVLIVHLAAIYSALLIVLIVTSTVGTPALLAMLNVVRNHSLASGRTL